MTDVVIVLDTRMVVAEVNDAAERLLGASRRDLVAHTVDELAPDHPQIRGIADRRDTGSDEISIVTGEHQRIFDRTVISQRTDSGAEIGVVVVLHDVTSLKEAERAARQRGEELAAVNEELRRTQEELVRQERLAAMGELIGTVSHELRNPLGTLRNALYALRNALKSDDPDRIERSIDLAERNSARINEMVEELLQFGRTRPVVFTDTDIDDYMGNLLRQLPVPDDVDMKPDLASGAVVALDRELYLRAFRNVYENAIESMEENKGRERRIAVSTRNIDELVEVSVSDTGCGIEPANLNKVFEPLFSTKSRGFGLGMAIVRRNMRRHGGDARIESTPGAGTTITLTIPLHRADHA